MQKSTPHRNHHAQHPTHNQERREQNFNADTALRNMRESSTSSLTIHFPKLYSSSSSHTSASHGHAHSNATSGRSGTRMNDDVNINNLPVVSAAHDLVVEDRLGDESSHSSTFSTSSGDSNIEPQSNGVADVDGVAAMHETIFNPLFGPNGSRKWASQSQKYNEEQPQSSAEDVPLHVLFAKDERYLTYGNPAVESEFLVYYLSSRWMTLTFCILATITSIGGVAMYQGLPETARILFGVTIMCWGCTGAATGYLMFIMFHGRLLPSSLLLHHHHRKESTTVDDVKATTAVTSSSFAALSVSHHPGTTSSSNLKRPAFLLFDENDASRNALRRNATIQEYVTLFTLAGNFTFAIANYIGKGDCSNPTWTYDDELRGCRRAIQAESTILLMIFSAAYMTPARFLRFAAIYIVCTTAMFICWYAASQVELIMAYFWGSVAVIGIEIAVCVVSLFLRERRARLLFEIHVQRHQRAAEVEQIRQRTERIVAGHLPLEAARACAARGAVSSHHSSVLFAWSKRTMVLGIGLRNFGAWSSRRGSADIVELLHPLVCRFDQLQNSFDSLPSKYPAFGDTYLLVDTHGMASTALDENGGQLNGGVAELYRFAVAALTTGTRLLDRLLKWAPMAEDASVPPVELVACMSIGVGGGMVNFETRNHFAVGPVIDEVLQVVGEPHAQRQSGATSSTLPTLWVDGSLALSCGIDVIHGVSSVAVAPNPLLPSYSGASRTEGNRSNAGSTSFADADVRSLTLSKVVDGVLVKVRKQEMVDVDGSRTVNVGGSVSAAAVTAGLLAESLTRGAISSTSGQTSIEIDIAKKSSFEAIAAWSDKGEMCTMAETVTPHGVSTQRSVAVSSGGSTGQQNNTHLLLDRQGDVDDGGPAVATIPLHIERTQLTRNWLLFTFSDGAMESAFQAARYVFTTGDVSWSVLSSLSSMVALVTLCFIDGLRSLGLTHPLLWAVLGCSMCILAELGITAVHDVSLRWPYVVILFLVQMCYLVTIAMGPTHTILGDSQMVYLFVQVQWTFNKPAWLPIGVMWLQDVLVAVFFFCRTWFFFQIGESSMYQLTLFAEAIMIPYLLIYRVVSDYTKRQVFAMECQLEFLKKELEEDSKRLHAAIEATVPKGIAGVLVQRARARNQELRQPPTAVNRGAIICTPNKEVPFVLVEILAFGSDSVVDDDESLEEVKRVSKCASAISAMARQTFKDRIQFVKASHNKFLFCSHSRSSDEDRASTVYEFAVGIAAVMQPLLSSVRYRVVVSSGCLVGAVIGRVGVTFDYYGASMPRAHALLSTLTWGTVAVTTRMMHLHLTNPSTDKRSVSIQLPGLEPLGAKVAGFTVLRYQLLSH